ncbi:MAG: F0F1 ATP synthase subunit epsilon [Bacteroidales bacterium]|nr:F0F1 ATP synthase subunit epsilon [Bacteroidales bacterium]
MDCIRLHILSPEGTMADVMAELVELPGSKGRFEVLKDHGSMLSSLDKGIIRWRNVDGESSLEIKEGFVEIHDNEIHACVEV